MIYVDGTVKKRKKGLARQFYGSSHKVGPRELEKVCQGGPEVFFIGTGHSGQIEVTDEARKYLSQRSIECQVFPTPQAVEAYNASKARKAALIHVTC